MIQTLPDFDLEVYLGEWEFAARHHLTASDAQSLTIADLLALAGEQQRAAFQDLPLSYTPTWGGDTLRAAIAATYERVEAEHVLTFAGAEEAIFWVLQELLKPGDHAIVTVPNYQSMESVTMATGAAVEALALREPDGWSIDLEGLERMLRPTTRLVAVNFPNNPTGALPDETTFRRLLELCDARGIRLLSDEVFRGLELDPRDTLPQAADLSAGALSLGAMSKSYGLPGLRIGWLACRDRALLERLERRKHYTSICNAGPSEALASIALENGDRIRQRNRDIIAGNLPQFDDFFSRWSERFTWEHPRGGCVCFPRLLTGERTSSFCRRLVREAGVVLLPADVFASQLAEVPGDRFRIGVGRLDSGESLDAFDGFLQRDPA